MATVAVAVVGHGAHAGAGAEHGAEGEIHCFVLLDARWVGAIKKLRRGDRRSPVTSATDAFPIGMRVGPLDPRLRGDDAVAMAIAVRDRDMPVPVSTCPRETLHLYYR